VIRLRALNKTQPGIDHQPELISSSNDHLFWGPPVTMTPSLISILPKADRMPFTAVSARKDYDEVLTATPSPGRPLQTPALLPTYFVASSH